MNIKIGKLGALGLLASVMLFFANGGTVAAHYMYQSGTLYYSSDDCTWGYSEISHGTGYGYTKAEVRSQSQGSAGTPCGASFSRPAGYLSNNSYLAKLLAPGWSFCRSIGQIYNTYETSYLTVARTHGNNCGSGAYNTYAELHMMNGSWKGGAIWADPPSLWRGHWL